MSFHGNMKTTVFNDVTNYAKLCSPYDITSSWLVKQREPLPGQNLKK